MNLICAGLIEVLNLILETTDTQSLTEIEYFILHSLCSSSLKVTAIFFFSKLYFFCVSWALVSPLTWIEMFLL